jgi:nicotinate phosphoribosyltransferase
MGIQRARPSHEILSGDSADVYFARADAILAAEGLDPLVTMEVFTRRDAVLCGIDEAKNLLGHVLATADPSETHLEALDDGDRIGPREIVLRIRGRYRQFGLYETALLGMLAHSTGWATAAREVVDAAAPDPVISFGARHVHPDITDVLDYAAIVGGCVGASTPAGARLAGLAPTGTMPHSLVLIFGDTVEAALAFDRHLGPEVARIVLVDTFKDEAEEALRVAHALGDKLYGIRPRLAIGRPSISLMSPVKSIRVAPLMYDPTAYESIGAPASLKYWIRSGVRPPDTTIRTCW